MPGIEMHFGERNSMFLWDLLGLCFCGNLLMEMLKRKSKYNLKLKREI